MKEKRNGIVSLWKFIFAISIVVFHCKEFYPNYRVPIFNYAYIGCEFFFIISGFYLAKSILKEKYNKATIGRETFEFIKKKLIRLIPYILIAYLIFIVIKIGFAVKLPKSYYINSIINLLLLHEFGITSTNILGQFWFLTSLYTALFILYPLIKKYKENFIYILSPLIVLFGLGYLFKNWGILDHSHATWNGYIKTGMLRGFIEVNLGMILYIINNRLKNIKYTSLGKFTITILGEFLLVIPLIVSSIAKKPKYDFIILLCITIGILIIVSKKTLEYKILSNKFIYYLDEISMLLYINHISVISLVKNANIKSLSPSQNVLATIAITIVFSMLEKAIIESKLIKMIKEKSISLFVKQ